MDGSARGNEEEEGVDRDEARVVELGPARPNEVGWCYGLGRPAGLDSLSLPSIL